MNRRSFAKALAALLAVPSAVRAAVTRERSPRWNEHQASPQPANVPSRHDLVAGECLKPGAVVIGADGKVYQARDDRAHSFIFLDTSVHDAGYIDFSSLR